jgi:voltage-gated potassium channel
VKKFAAEIEIEIGIWNWNMEEHNLIINAFKNNHENYFTRLIIQIRENTDYQNIPVQLLNTDSPRWSA